VLDRSQSYFQGLQVDGVLTQRTDVHVHSLRAGHQKVCSVKGLAHYSVLSDVSTYYLEASLAGSLLCRLSGLCFGLPSSLLLLFDLPLFFPGAVPGEDIHLVCFCVTVQACRCVDGWSFVCGRRKEKMGGTEGGHIDIDRAVARRITVCTAG
jgi:hypothetical protein